MFTQKPTQMYTKIFFGIQRGFQELGIHVEGLPMLLPHEALTTFCQEMQADVVLEMDRTRKQVPSLPKHIQHISWMVDFNNPFCDGFQGSDLLYFFGKDWFTPQDQSRYQVGKIDWLPPGYCPHQFFYEERPWQWDFSFVGHIPNPWTEADNARIVSHHQGREIRFAEAVQLFQHFFLQRVEPPFTYMEPLHQQVVDDALHHLQQATGCHWQSLPQSLQHDLTMRSRRLYNRQRFIDHIFTVSQQVALFGTGGWSKWPHYAPYFGGYLGDIDRLRQVFQASRINLHDGLPSHFRVFDCLASGGFLFFRQPLRPLSQLGIQELLTPGEDFILVNDDNFAPLARYWLDHPDQRRQFSQRTAEKVANNHTWKVRAERILHDLAHL
ncbi:MAG: glycosyltransferase family 1 protein [Magnetococcales bacterium]|nr:glycosyltransferase family 1 protein [Magnetococcales bacterium]